MLNNNKLKNVKRQHLADIFSLPHLKNQQELNVLVSYNNYILQQLDETKLHPYHKEEVKSVLLQAIAEAKVTQQNERPAVQNQNWFFRVLQKMAR